jgi:hypothetical protein
VAVLVGWVLASVAWRRRELRLCSLGGCSRVWLGEGVTCGCARWAEARECGYAHSSKRTQGGRQSNENTCGCARWLGARECGVEEA